MELIRDLIRDIVGILFPGGLLIFFTVWFLFGVLVIFIPPASLFETLPYFSDLAVFSILIIFSYIAGQFLRLKRLAEVETQCTEAFQKKKESESEISHEKFLKSVKSLDKAKEKYSSGNMNLEQLKEKYRNHMERFGVWEEFPYPYHMEGSRLLRYTTEYNRFFEKYEKEGVMKTDTFFNFCKSVLFDYSPSLKEEALRQESLIRLFSGIFYAIKYGKIVNIAVGAIHILLILNHFFKIVFLPYEHIGYSSVIILAICISAFATIWFMKSEILRRLRIMRLKELGVVYNGFYIICKKHKLDL